MLSPTRFGGAISFVKTVAAKYIDRELLLVVDNLGTHFTAEVRDWLADNPNITFRRTPVGDRGHDTSVA
jgi:hypothetical protein